MCDCTQVYMNVPMCAPQYENQWGILGAVRFRLNYMQKV